MQYLLAGQRCPIATHEPTGLIPTDLHLVCQCKRTLKAPNPCLLPPGLPKCSLFSSCSVPLLLLWPICSSQAQLCSCTSSDLAWEGSVPGSAERLEAANSYSRWLLVTLPLQFRFEIWDGWASALCYGKSRNRGKINREGLGNSLVMEVGSRRLWQ